MDVTQGAAVARAMERASGAGLDVLVNNAGTTTVQRTEEMPLDEWERILRVNLHGTFLCCRAAIPHLRRRAGAAIVNISSSSALVGGGGGAHYAASKAGVDGLTRHLARELAPVIRVNSIQPRTVETDLFRPAMRMPRWSRAGCASKCRSAGSASPKTSPMRSLSWRQTGPTSLPDRSS